MPPRHHHPRVVRIVDRALGRGPHAQSSSSVRFEYGEDIPWVRAHRRGLRAIAGPNALVLDSPVAFEGREHAQRGDASPWAPARTGGDGAQLAPLPRRASRSCSMSSGPCTRRWRGGRSGATRIAEVHGEWQEAVLRSLMTLKALTYAPTGGIVAAATTSLPEDIGGVRNWDYRYCWVRDATLTLDALIEAGYRDEAEAWMRWLGRAAAGAPEQLQIMYGVGRGAPPHRVRGRLAARLRGVRARCASATPRPASSSSTSTAS